MANSATEPARGSRMSDADRKALFDKLDAADAENPAKNRRAMARVPFRKTDVACRIYHPGGSMITAAVDTRNLSAGGTSFIYHGFLHKNTKVEIILKRRLGGEDTVAGTVTHCQLIKGVFHLVGVRFAAKVFPKLYLEPSSWSDLGDASPVDLTSLAGAVLHLDAAEMDRLLLKHNVDGTKIELTGVSTLDEATAALKAKPFDCVLCDTNVGRAAGPLIAALRDTGFPGPIGMVTAEAGPAEKRMAMDAGAETVLAKPYDKQKLLSVLGAWLAAGSVNGEAVYSTLPDSPQTKPLLEQYVQRARVLVRDLRKFISSDDLKNVRAVCQTLKGTGAGFGFASIGQIAKDAVTTLDETSSIHEAQVHLQRLELQCRRLAVK